MSDIFTDTQEGPLYGCVICDETATYRCVHKFPDLRCRGCGEFLHTYVKLDQPMIPPLETLADESLMDKRE